MIFEKNSYLYYKTNSQKKITVFCLHGIRIIDNAMSSNRGRL